MAWLAGKLVADREQDRLALDSIGFDCPLAAVYEGTRFVCAEARASL